MTNTPIILVPGFWLGAWAWNEVAATLRADGHDVTALTLPGLESADADRSSITLSDHVDAIADAVEATGRPVVLARAQRHRLLRLRRERSGPRADRGDGLRRYRAGHPAPRPRLRRRREADVLGGDLGGGEPRGAQRGAARDVPAAGGPGAGRGPARRAPSSRTTRGSTSRAPSSAPGTRPRSTRRR